MKIYAVFDTNILVSAMISKRSDTAVVLALDTLLNDEVIPLYNDEIIKEYNEVLHRKKFHLPEALVNSVIDHIQKADAVFVYGTLRCRCRRGTVLLGKLLPQSRIQRLPQ